VSNKRRTVEQRVARMTLRQLYSDSVEKRVFEYWTAKFDRACRKGLTPRSATAEANAATAKAFRITVRSVQKKLELWRRIEQLKKEESRKGLALMQGDAERADALKAAFGDELHSFDPDTLVADLYPLATVRAVARIKKLQAENRTMQSALEAAQRKLAQAEQRARDAEIRAGAAEMARSRRN